MITTELLYAVAHLVTYPSKDKVTPGFAGFVTMFLLAIAVLLLILSMVRHLRKIRYSVPPSDSEGPAGAAESRAGEPKASTDDSPGTPGA